MVVTDVYEPPRRKISNCLSFFTLWNLHKPVHMREEFVTLMTFPLRATFNCVVIVSML